MLPTPLQGTYQQYKADTGSVAAWLASTAKACGYPADPLPSTAGQSSQPKGGAPVEASRPKYIIAIKDLIPLAEYIFASTKPLISVPKSLAETIDRVIYMRSRFGAQLEEHGSEVNDKSDATHNYFIGVLDSIRSVLRPRMPTDTPSYDSIEDLTNRFSGLNVYEPSQEFLDAPDIVRPQKADDDENTYEAEPQNTPEDAMIAYAVMLDDLTHIRSNIKPIWANYKDGFYNFAIAALVTNTGIDLARNLMEPILPIFEPHGDACAVSEKFSIVFAMMKGFSITEAKAWGPKGGDEKMYDIADDTFLNANILLKEGLLINRWQDMDVVRSLLGDFNFFVGSPPKNKDEYLNRFLLQMGYSASAITTHKGRLLRQAKRHQDMASCAGPRGIEDGVPVSRMFFDRYLHEPGQVNLTPENVDAIVSRSNYLEDNSEDELAFVKAEDGGRLKADSLLQPLAMALTVEMFEFSFPYLVLDWWSWKFLRQIKSVCGPMLPKLYGPAYLDQEKQLPLTVGYILMTLAEDPDGDGEELMRIAAGEFNGLVCQKGIGNVAIRAAGKMYGLEFEDDDNDSDLSELPDLE
ncbi:hypothetical protein FCOIX_7694 [Fusarium coicis]|nr:hypothetical protein FCOIX_7694 [Fusarium coicis]